jgi:hypothetical protein
VRLHHLPPTQFVFGKDGKRAEKFSGVQELGPYRPVLGAPPKIGFVFPSDCRDQANNLYLALKNGAGTFRGIESVFRIPLSKDAVFPITGFTRQGKTSDSARAYAEAILSALAKHAERPDFVFVLAPHTATREANTPYYESKATLLKAGVLSQAVTLELLQDASRFEWSAANIALAAFVKLGGTPWIVDTAAGEGELVLGMGRAELYNWPQRTRTRSVAFTTCFTSGGEFRFFSLAELAQTPEEFATALRNAVTSSVRRAADTSVAVRRLTLHIPKDMSRDEAKIISEAASSQASGNLEVRVVKVTDEEHFFAVDSSRADGVPERGTVVQTADRDFLLYTEGREENRAWKFRVPTALRISPQRGALSSAEALELVRGVHELSQVNWRGFNARSRPISVFYGSLIARMLAHLSPETIRALYEPAIRHVLETRMWFL